MRLGRHRRYTQQFTTNNALVLDYLARLKKAVTAEDLYIEMRTSNEMISLSTVYRHLGILAEQGAIMESHPLRARMYAVK